jgi:predicted nuclease of predicted toxin-antitoxin system
MKFLADMGVSWRLVQWLRGAGHDAVHLRERNWHRLENGAIFERAAEERRVVLTFDLDFGEILAMSGSRVVSVVLFRLNDTTTSFVIRRLEVVLSQAADALEAGAIVVVEDGRYRVRRLPLAR